MTVKQITTARAFSHVVLFLLSMMLSVNLFIRFTDTYVLKYLFALMAMAMETIKLYIFIVAKDSFFTKHSWRKKIAFVFQFCVYLGLAFISVIASLGFTLMEIEEQSFQATIARTTARSTVERDAIIRDIDSIEYEIQSTLRRQEALPGEWVTASQRFSEDISNLRERRNALFDRLEELQTQAEAEQVTATSSSDMFTLLGSVVSMSGRDTMFYMMLILVFLLELSIALTAGEIKKEAVLVDVPVAPTIPESPPSIPVTKNEDDKREEVEIEHISHDLHFKPDKVVVYTEAVHNIGGADDATISRLTGISLDECVTIHNLLQKVLYKGKPLLNPKTNKLTYGENTLKILNVYYNIHGPDLMNGLTRPKERTIKKKPMTTE